MKLNSAAFSSPATSRPTTPQSPLRRESSPAVASTASTYRLLSSSAAHGLHAVVDVVRLLEEHQQQRGKRVVDRVPEVPLHPPSGERLHMEASPALVDPASSMTLRNPPCGGGSIMVAGGGDGVVEGVPASSGAPRPDAATLPTPGGVPSTMNHGRRLSSPSSNPLLVDSIIQHPVKMIPRERTTKSGSVPERRLSQDESIDTNRLKKEADASQTTGLVTPHANSICDEQQPGWERPERSPGRISNSVSTDGGTNGVCSPKNSSKKFANSFVSTTTTLPTQPASASSSTPLILSSSLSHSVSSSSSPSIPSSSHSIPSSSSSPTTSIASHRTQPCSLPTGISSFPPSVPPSSSLTSHSSLSSSSVPSSVASSFSTSSLSPCTTASVTTSPLSSSYAKATAAQRLPPPSLSPSPTILHPSSPSLHQHQSTSAPIASSPFCSTALLSSSSSIPSQAGLQCSTPLTSKPNEPSVHIPPPMSHGHSKSAPISSGFGTIGYSIKGGGHSLAVATPGPNFFSLYLFFN